MKLLYRILIVLTFALLGMQGASACEHGNAMRASTVHCHTQMNTSDSNAPCSHTHASCCTTACGAHCCALLSGAGVSARAASSSVPARHSDSRRASITRAPPVPPPIV